MTAHHTIYFFDLSQESLDLSEINKFPHLDNQTNPNWQTLGGVPINQVRDIAFPHWRLKINKIFGL